MKRIAGRILAAIAATVTLGVVGLVAFGRTLTLSLTLAFPAAEAWIGPFLAEAIHEEVTLAADGQDVQADLYRPTAPRASLLLVHGLSRAGRRHAELVRLARLLARHGQLVLVPELGTLTAFRLSGHEVVELRAALGYLAGFGHPVGIVGFSFGAGPALLAAADVPGLWLVGAFGGYADLGNVIRYVTTGVHTFGGRRYVQRAEDYNRWKLLALLVGFVEGEGDRHLLDVIAGQKLGDPATDTGGLEASVGGEGRAVLELVMNRRESAVDGLLARLPARARQALVALSPLGVVPRLPGRLLIAHGAADDSIPFTESLRLAEAAGGRAGLWILHTFHHTAPRPFWPAVHERLQDAWSLLRLADGLLRGPGRAGAARAGGPVPAR